MAEPLTLKEAREYIDKAIALSGEFGRITAWAVADEGGNPISISRMDGAPALAVAAARAKAYLSAITKSETGGFGTRMNRLPERWMTYLRLTKETGFPGPGAVPIMKGDQCVGGFSSSLNARGQATRELPVIDGERANAEDYVTCEALGIPYKNQH